MEDLVFLLGFLAVYLGILGIGGIIADYVLPHIPPLRRWIDSLPEMEDDTELYQQEKERLRRNRAARRKRVKRLMRRLVNGNRV